jgi:hypothetical protein
VIRAASRRLKIMGDPTKVPAKPVDPEKPEEEDEEEDEEKA